MEEKDGQEEATPDVLVAWIIVALIAIALIAAHGIGAS